jgi:methylisocitrate lyase
MPTEKRRRLHAAIHSGNLQQFPGAFSPLVAMLIEEQGWHGVYISGSVIAADLGLPDIGLTTMSEVAQRGHQIARATSLPAVIDVDTGFGEVLNVVRSVQELERLGLAGCHLEDQENPKRCGHLDHKSLIETEVMVRKLRAAAQARRDPHFLIIARTDARAVEGLQKTIERARAYIDAGADVIFPEALQSEKEFALVRESLSAPLLANMTEFGKSPLLSKQTLEDLGYNLVIYPVTGLRLAMKAVEDGLSSLAAGEEQASLLAKMQSRRRLYQLLRYADYATFDQQIYNFELD